MPFMLQLNPLEYVQRIPPEQWGEVAEWMCSIAGPDTEDILTNRNGAVAIHKGRWVGEQFEARIFRRDPRVVGGYRGEWWTPPSPPPAWLMQYADQVPNLDS